MTAQPLFHGHLSYRLRYSTVCYMTSHGRTDRARMREAVCGRAAAGLRQSVDHIAEAARRISGVRYAPIGACPLMRGLSGTWCA